MVLKQFIGKYKLWLRRSNQTSYRIGFGHPKHRETPCRSNKVSVDIGSVSPAWAGTRWRGATPEEDQQLEADLLADPKERAEHLMLVDLGRNDAGRVAEIGSVEVDEYAIVERYSHVMHIVSNVHGKLRPGLDWLDVLRATFPAGTLSGAPKVRAMEIIDELETVRRGFFGGCCGYLDYSGNMDMAITIRTMWKNLVASA